MTCATEAGLSSSAFHVSAWFLFGRFFVGWLVRSFVRLFLRSFVACVGCEDFLYKIFSQVFAPFPSRSSVI